MWNYVLTSGRIATIFQPEILIMAFSKNEFYLGQEFAKRLKPLDHSARIQILLELLDGPKTFAALEANQSVPRSTLTNHLAQLLTVGYLAVDKHQD